MSYLSKRDRPASNPGGRECEECGVIFIGADWHFYCGICVEKVAIRESIYREKSKTKKDVA